jgi:hypothetical protein
MAVAVVMDFEGGTLEQYDEVVDRMGFAREGAGAPGGLFHWVTSTDNGIRVTDVWNTRDEFDQFAAQTIGPITRDVGIPQEPEVSVHEVHNYLTAG